MSFGSVAPAAYLAETASDPRAALIDVRSPAEFAGAHAAGARNAPLDGLDAAALGALGVTPGDPVALICATGVRARKAAERLGAAGFAHVTVVEGGLAAWRNAGLPVTEGQGGVISLERQVRIAAGSLVVIGVLIAATLTPWGLLLAGFVGAGLVFAGVTDTCGLGLLLARAPWNRR